MPVVRLHIREDGERGLDGVWRQFEPKAIAVDGPLPTKPGKVVEVVARSSKEAREVYALSLLHLTPNPDRHAWADAEGAREKVKVIRG